MRQKRSFLPVIAAPRQINRLGWTKTYGKTNQVLAGFWPFERCGFLPNQT
jgi:hypothetical protein